jgi:hypothetical protein
MFDAVQMNQDHRPGPDPDRILVAELTGTARHHARWRELAQDEQDAAVTELHELAGGRADLLAQVAGSSKAHPTANWTSHWPGRPRNCAAWQVRMRP